MVETLQLGVSGSGRPSGAGAAHRPVASRFLPAVILLAALSLASGAAPPDQEVLRVEAQIALDVLERFATPYSDISSVFPDDTEAGAVRRNIPAKDILAMVAIADDDAALLIRTLKRANIEQFELVWEPAVGGPALGLRKCRLTCRAVAPPDEQKHHSLYFRVWCMR